MATKTWVGGAGTWDDAADWSPQGELGASDDAVIGACAIVALPSSTVQANSISLAGPTAVLKTQAASSGVYLNGLLPGQGMLGGSIVLVGSSDAAQPAGIGGFDLTLDTNLSVDVTGAAYLGSGISPFQPNLTTLTTGATVNVGPGGNLALGGDFGRTGTIHVASGTLDLSDASPSSSNPSFPLLVQMDDGAAKVVLDGGVLAAVKGFRAGDVLDSRNDRYPFGVVGLPPYPSGPFQAALQGGQLQVSYNGTVIKSVTLAGPQAPGATDQASSSGANDILVTTTAQPAAAAPLPTRPLARRAATPSTRSPAARPPCSGSTWTPARTRSRSRRASPRVAGAPRRWPSPAVP